jgi:DMSO/TMAO reductase YedYZ molybdopterin-dependent catalytic subunit
VRVRAGVAGVVGVGLALGVAELGAGLLPGVPSLVGAVAQQVVPATPPAVSSWAISTFGTRNKLVLELGTVLLALGIGAGAGMLALRRIGAAWAVFGAFAVLGVLAALQETGARPLPVIVTTATAVAAGLSALHRLVASATSGAGPAPAPVGPAPGAGPAATAGPGPAATAGPDPAATAGASPTDPPLARRGFLTLAGGLAAVAVTGAATGRLVLSSGSSPVDLSEVTLPAPARSLAAPGPAQALAIDGLSPVITPTEGFFRIDTALSVPRVDPDTWRLRIHGLVEREVELTYDDLLAMPLEEFDVTLSCVSNEVGGDLVGNARWSGVRLDALLDRAGVRPEAGQVVGRSVDGWTGGFPIEAVLDGRDAIVAVGMNGEPLPTRHGFPARLVVPGLYGYVSATKWLEEVELTTWEGFDGYWVPRGWSKRGPIKTQSRIDVPGDGARVAAGEVVVAGVAWAPTRGVAAVEVEVDGSGTWQEAQRSEPLSDDAWVQWRTVVELTPGTHRLRVRATDGTAATQPGRPRPPAPDGAEGWHAVRVEALGG